MIGIIGGTSGVGTSVAKFLLAQKQKICLLTRNPQTAQLLFPSCQIRKFDFAEPNADALQGMSCLFWLLPDHHDALLAHESAWLEYAKACGVTHIVKLSVMHADTKDIFQHRASEVAIEKSGIAYTHLRANAFMENFRAARENILATHTLTYPANQYSISFISRDDVAEIAAKILIHPKQHTGKAYVLTGQEAVNYSTIATIFSQCSGQIFTYSSNKPEGFDPIEDAFFHAVRQGFFSEVITDSKAVLGRAPLSFAEYCYFKNPLLIPAHAPTMQAAVPAIRFENEEKALTKDNEDKLII